MRLEGLWAVQLTVGGVVVYCWWTLSVAAATIENRCKEVQKRWKAVPQFPHMTRWVLSPVLAQWEALWFLQAVIRLKECRLKWTRLPSHQSFPISLYQRQTRTHDVSFPNQKPNHRVLCSAVFIQAVPALFLLAATMAVAAILRLKLKDKRRTSLSRWKSSRHNSRWKNNHRCSRVNSSMCSTTWSSRCNRDSLCSRDIYHLQSCSLCCLSSLGSLVFLQLHLSQSPARRSTPLVHRWHLRTRRFQQMWTFPRACQHQRCCRTMLRPRQEYFLIPVCFVTGNVPIWRWVERQHFVYLFDIFLHLL